MVCRNELTKGVIERKYYSEICNILKTNGFNEELVLNVENIQ